MGGVWLRQYHEAAHGAVRLVCFPFAGGSANYFLGLSRLLAPDVQVLAVQYPGRQDRRHEPCVESVPALADGVVGELPPDGDGADIALFGHSMGALVAFETALRRTPAHLFVSGAVARLYRPGRPVTEEDVLAHLREMGGTDARLFANPELQRLVLPVLRADYQAVAAYDPPGAVRLPCPVTALIGDRDPRTTPLEAATWRGRTDAAFDLQVLPGGHFYLDACQERVAGIVTGALARR
ncbi:thioesterase II family protein [Streptomyces acidiscabies]|uniref:thioesterase II family protein n=1 Tax=Streptomyces acidiscabies TaxID=42234 RepID=UPI00095353E6|nr:alpha/beta fold hydrolase [Streptomyces acidiscabies]